jgi:hypothetical protein
VIAGGDIRFATRSLLTMEGFSVALIVILVVVIFVRLIVGEAPSGHESSLGDAFSLPSGTTLDAIATASVFGFLSFAGFEGAAALGEETDQPRRNIPRAVFLAPLTRCSASRSCASRSTRTSRAPPRRTATSRGTCSPGSRSAPCSSRRRRTSCAGSASG